MHASGTSELDVSGSDGSVVSSYERDSSGKSQELEGPDDTRSELLQAPVSVEELQYNEKMW